MFIQVLGETNQTDSNLDFCESLTYNIWSVLLKWQNAIQSVKTINLPINNGKSKLMLY